LLPSNTTGSASFKTIGYLFFSRSLQLVRKPTIEQQRSDEFQAILNQSLQLEREQLKQQQDGQEYPNTMTAYKSHPTLVLASQFNKTQAVVPGARSVHSFTVSTKGKERLETVYRVEDVVNCRSKAAWFKEGRAIKSGEIPLKTERIKPSTRNGKRKLESYTKYRQLEETEQGLFSFDQTIPYVAQPVEDGILPKNEFGTIECFTASMVPKGAVHMRNPGIAKIAKKLGIDFAPAIVGFRFQSRHAKPDIDGVVVAEENKELLLDAWRAEQAAKQETESATRVKEALERWKLFLARLRLLKRLRDTYGHEKEIDKRA